MENGNVDGYKNFQTNIWNPKDECRRRHINSLKRRNAYIRRWTGSSSRQIMTCRLFGAKLLSKPTLKYYQLCHKEHIPIRFYLNSKVLVQKIYFNVPSVKWRSFCLCLNALNTPNIVVMRSVFSDVWLFWHQTSLNCTIPGTLFMDLFSIAIQMKILIWSPPI